MRSSLSVANASRLLNPCGILPVDQNPTTAANFQLANMKLSRTLTGQEVPTPWEDSHQILWILILWILANFRQWQHTTGTSSAITEPAAAPLSLISTIRGVKSFTAFFLHGEVQGRPLVHAHLSKKTSRITDVKTNHVDQLHDRKVQTPNVLVHYSRTLGALFM